MALPVLATVNRQASVHRLNVQGYHALFRRKIQRIIQQVADGLRDQEPFASSAASSGMC